MRAFRLWVCVMTWASVACLGCGDDQAARGPTGPEAPDAPDAPSNVRASPGVQRTTVSWDAVPGASSYNVYWSTSSGVTPTSGTKVEGIGGSPFTHGSLAAGTYHYVVTAVGDGGESAESTEVSAGVNRVAFVSSATGQGDLGAWPQADGKTGTAAGDAICQALASAAGLQGSFRAYLSDGSDDAYCRVQGLTGKKAANCGQATPPAGAGPWIRTDGAGWAGTFDSITSIDGIEDVRVPLVCDESGAVVQTTEYIGTGTYIDGTEAGMNEHCQGWTSSSNAESIAMGRAFAVGASWGSSSGSSCSATIRLGCLESGTGPVLPPVTPIAGAKTAFLTSSTGTGALGSWPEAGGKTGVAAGDAVCQARAAAAGLAGAPSFKAWLGVTSTGAKPIDRITSNGPWVRVDGIQLARDRADLGGGSILAGLNIDESGSYVSMWDGAGYVWAWTGARANTTCQDWTSVLAGARGETGGYPFTNRSWSEWAALGCDRPQHLYCFED